MEENSKPTVIDIVQLCPVPPGTVVLGGVEEEETVFALALVLMREPNGDQWKTIIPVTSFAIEEPNYLHEYEGDGGQLVAAIEGPDYEALLSHARSRARGE